MSMRPLKLMVAPGSADTVRVCEQINFLHLQGITESEGFYCVSCTSSCPSWAYSVLNECAIGGR